MIRQPSCVYDNFSIIEHAGLLQSEESVYESIQDVQISEINRIVSKEYSKTAGSRKPSIAFITLRADEFLKET
jgi:hypothetical protein